MKTVKIGFLFLLITSKAFSQANLELVTYDIDNFWQAYDQITATKDSSLQYDYLNHLFLAKGSPGLKALMQARTYTAQSYIDAIHNYPLFWASIRPNFFAAPFQRRDCCLGAESFFYI